MGTLAFIYGTAFALGLVLTIPVIRLAHSRGFVDAPGLRKVHRDPIPNIGGVAIWAAVWLAVIASVALSPFLRNALLGEGWSWLALACGAMMVFGMGLIDDLRGMQATKKLSVQIAAALLLCMAGVRIDSIDLGFAVVEFGVMSWPITILWIAGVTNAVNLIDGLDGLAGGICAIGAGALALYALLIGNPVVAGVMIALLGATSGFLIFNLHPARIFLGDSGSYFLGFLISTAGIMAMRANHSPIGLGVTILALSVPLFDTAFSMLRRLLQRRSMFAPDRNHIHHALLRRGLGHSQAVRVLHGVTAGASVTAIVMVALPASMAPLLFLAAIGLLVMFFGSFGTIRLRESVRVFHHNLLVKKQIKEEQRLFENAQLRFREATGFSDWWAGVCEIAGQLRFHGLTLELIGRDGHPRVLAWRREPEADAAQSFVLAALPINDRRSGPPLMAQVHVDVDDTMEASGRRLAMFIRLMEEFSLRSLPTVRSAARQVEHEYVPQYPPQKQSVHS